MALWGCLWHTPEETSCAKVQMCKSMGGSKKTKGPERMQNWGGDGGEG